MSGRANFVEIVEKPMARTEKIISGTAMAPIAEIRALNNREGQTQAQPEHYRCSSNQHPVTMTDHQAQTHPAEPGVVPRRHGGAHPAGPRERWF